MLSELLCPKGHSVSRDPLNLFRRPLDLGVLVCEAFMERSEQRTNKYPEVGGCVALAGGRGVLGARSPQRWLQRPYWDGPLVPGGRGLGPAPTVSLYVAAGPWHDADASARVRAPVAPGSYHENDRVVVAGGRGAFD